MTGAFDISQVRLELLDLPPLQDEHRSQPGFYVAACSYDQKLGFRGALLFASTDLGETWEQVAQIDGQAVMGYVVTAPTVSLTVTPGGTTDRINTIRVKVRHTELALRSVTTEEMYRGRNRFLVGDEILGAADIDLVSTDSVTRERTYDLNQPMLRGLKDTDDEIAGHAAGERFVWLDGPGVQFVPLSYASAEDARLYRAVPHGGILATARTYKFTLTGRTTRPFAVSEIAATRDGSNNVTFTWARQTRAETQYLDQGEPLDEDAEAYLVEIMDKATGLVVTREFTPATATQAYSSGEQTTDGYTPGDAINVQVRQTSAGMHYGRMRAATV